MAKISIENKKEVAKTLFLKGDLTQKDIAEKVGISEVTLSKWVNVGKWGMLRSTLVATRDEHLARLYMQLGELNDRVMKRPEGERFVNSKEADTLSKLTASIRSLELQSSLTETINVCVAIVRWLRGFDLQKAKEVSTLFDTYIKGKLVSRER